MFFRRAKDEDLAAVHALGHVVAPGAGDWITAFLKNAEHRGASEIFVLVNEQSGRVCAVAELNGGYRLNVVFNPSSVKDDEVRKRLVFGNCGHAGRILAASSISDGFLQDPSRPWFCAKAETPEGKEMLTALGFTEWRPEVGMPYGLRRGELSPEVETVRRR
jgi:hypothetical protein